MTNEYAFPQSNDRVVATLSTANSKGMTLRDYFAAKAMQGLLASYGGDLEPNPKLCAEWSYAMSDAMMKARQA